MDVGWRLPCRSQTQQRNTMRQTKLGEPCLSRPERRCAICGQMAFCYRAIYENAGTRESQMECRRAVVTAVGQTAAALIRKAISSGLQCPASKMLTSSKTISFGIPAPVDTKANYDVRTRLVFPTSWPHKNPKKRHVTDTVLG